MITKEFIRDFIPPLKQSDTGKRALQWMQTFHLNHLPVVEGQNYLGMITEDDIRSRKNLDDPIGAYGINYNRVFIYESQYIYDALQFISNNKYSIVPVLNSENHYEGLLTVVDVIDCFAQSKSVKTPGSIVILSVPVKNFSLADIAQVVEVNEGIILSATVNQPGELMDYEVTLKINKIDLSRILSAFFRLNYNVIASYQKADLNGDLEDRYNAFMSYLNV